MLILTRKRDERILIGDDIDICVVAIEGDRVRIGIEAPREINVVRKEIVDGDPCGPRCQSKEKRCGG